MKVLMINRADLRQVPGGDGVQMHKTRSGLQGLGVQVDIRLTDELDGNWDYDLVHVFNIQSANDSWRACQMAKSKGLPVALSPIYWNFSALWYWTKPDLHPAWSLLRTSLGKQGFPLYARWQRSRSRFSEAWTLQRQLLLAADVILPNSHLESAEIGRDFYLERGQCTFAVVPNAIDQRLFEKPTQPSELIRSLLGVNRFVLQVGRISPEKNCIALIDALWQIDIPIVFIGKESPYSPEYVRMCRERATRRGNVYFVNEVPYEQLPGIYSLATVHALPSWRETPGLVSLEAAAAGCRIVSTSIGSAREYFGDDAWYCHPADVRSIRTAVLQALNAKGTSELRQRVLDNFTWDNAAEATLAAYRAILES